MLRQRIHLHQLGLCTTMDAADTSHRVILTGEVVETFEHEGKQIAKISLRSCHIEIPMELIDAAHLGDNVRLSVTVSTDRTGNADQYS